MIKGKALAKKISISSAHSSKIFGAIFALTISAISISSFYIKGEINKKYESESSKALEKNKQTQSEIKAYNEVKKNRDEIISGISKIQKSDLFIKHFTAKTQDAIFELFEKSEGLPIDKTVELVDCKTLHEKLSNTKSGKCFKITGKIIRFDDDKVVLKFDKYIKYALPGFVFTKNIEVKKTTLQDNTRQYDATFEYHWIYFESLV